MECAFFRFMDCIFLFHLSSIPPEMGGTRAADVVGSIPAFQAGWAGSNPVRRSMAGNGLHTDCAMCLNIRRKRWNFPLLLSHRRNPHSILLSLLGGISVTAEDMPWRSCMRRSRQSSEKYDWQPERRHNERWRNRRSCVPAWDGKTGRAVAWMVIVDANTNPWGFHSRRFVPQWGLRLRAEKVETVGEHYTQIMEKKAHAVCKSQPAQKL